MFQELLLTDGKNSYLNEVEEEQLGDTHQEYKEVRYVNNPGNSSSTCRKDQVGLISSCECWHIRFRLA